MTQEATATLNRLALVIGATGGVGGAVAHALIQRGWRVRAINRNPAEAAAKTGWIGPMEWVAGDAMNPADVTRAAEGAALIFHGANPPGYRNWRGLAIPMLRNAIHAARASDARLFFPANVYNFGPDAGDWIAEEAPQNPLTEKGRIRVEMERILETAALDGVRSVIVRAGDFFGPSLAHSWFSSAVIKPGAPLRQVTYPGTPGVGHSWAYLPDLARCFALLAERERELPAFERFHFEGHWCAPGISMAEAVARAAGDPSLPIKPLPWFLFYLAAPFVTFIREALKMRYLWKQPLRLNNAKLVAFLGAEPSTPLDVAVRETLSAQGCLAKESTLP